MPKNSSLAPAMGVSYSVDLSPYQNVRFPCPAMFVNLATTQNLALKIFLLLTIKKGSPAFLKQVLGELENDL